MTEHQPDEGRPGGPGGGSSEQLDLLPAPERARAAARSTARSAKATTGTGRRRAAGRKPTEPADELPVARVLVDVPLAHLDRPFDYLVPAAMADSAVPGSRVKVRFAGQDVDGFVLVRAATSEHGGRLAPLRRSVSAEPVLSVEVAELSARVAARYAGTRSDVLRLAVPPRHATVEKEPAPPPARAAEPARLREAAAAGWAAYPDGGSFLAAAGAGSAPRAVWSAAPGEDWPARLAEVAAAAYASGRGALLCVPDHRDVARLDAALTVLLGDGHHVALTADLGPAARYRAFLQVSRGARRIVIGTRAAAFAPVHDLGLVAVWDDGDDLYAEPRAPYPHTREVLLLRAEDRGCAALVGGFARTVEAEYLLRTGWARELGGDRAQVRDRSPRISITGASDRELERDPFARAARLPHTAMEAIRVGLQEQRGAVLVQTPRQGYATALACERCRAPARCPACAGPLALPAAHRPPTCRWCGTEQPAWSCAECGGRGLRAPVRGEARTGEELGRAFPGVPVRTSAADRVLDSVGEGAAIVVATPGAEPVAAGGYACVVLLDTWLPLSRPDLRTEEESLRRWLNAAALARSGPAGGRVVAVGDSAHPALQALLRWDPAGFARREMAERMEAHLPPASRMAVLSGPEHAVTGAVQALELPAGAEVLGPAPAPDPPRRAPDTAGPDEPEVRTVIRVPRAAGLDLARTLVRMRGVRDAKKLTAVRVRLDPHGLG